MRRLCVVPFPSETIESALITAQVDNLLLIKELHAQNQLQKHQNIVTLSMVNNKDTRTARIALLLVLPRTSPQNFTQNY